MEPQLIILTGFRASGKTTAGQHLAKLCGWSFLDTDAALAARMGCSIAEAVKKQGWPYFREQEKRLLVELTAWRQTVIAVGGGAVLHQNEWRQLRRQALVAWLRTDLATTLARLGQDVNTAHQRPALNGNQDMAAETAAMLIEREPMYQAGSDVTIDTENRTPEDVAKLVFLKCSAAMTLRITPSCG